MYKFTSPVFISEKGVILSLPQLQMNICIYKADFSRTADVQFSAPRNCFRKFKIWKFSNF